MVNTFNKLLPTWTICMNRLSAQTPTEVAMVSKVEESFGSLVLLKPVTTIQP